MGQSYNRLRSEPGLYVADSSTRKQFGEGRGEHEAPNRASQASATGTIAVTSVPDGADVFADGAFVGNCPATLKLNAGKHSVRVSTNSYKDWTRDVTVQDGSDVKLTATLEKQN